MKSTTTLNNLKICTWNCRGIKSSVPYVRQLCERYDIVMITEHWLHANRLSELSEISDDMSFIARSSKFSGAEEYGLRRGQGGVSIFWKREIVGISPINDFTHDRICGIRLQNNIGAVFNIYCVYMPARGCEGCLDQTLDELSGILDKSETGAQFIIGGDLNGDMGSLGGPHGLRDPTKEGTTVYNFVCSHNLVATNLLDMAVGPVNTYHGPIGESCIDYLLVPVELQGNLTHCENLDQECLNSSDHNAILMSLDLGTIEKTLINITHKGRLKWGKLSKQELYERYAVPIKECFYERVDEWNQSEPNPELIDLTLEVLVTSLKKGEEAIPRSKFRKHQRPFWCDQLDILKKEKIFRFNEWVSAGRPRDPANAVRQRHLHAKKIFNQQLRTLEKKYNDDQITQAVLTAEVDRNTFWGMLRKTKTAGKLTTSAIKNKYGKVVHDLDQVLEAWRSHFSSLCQPRDSPTYDKTHFNNVSTCVREWLLKSDKDEFLESEFSKDEIRNAISKLNSGKAPGHDSITKEHLIAAGETIVDWLYMIFKWILKIEYIPINFRKGIQIPLHKGKNAPVLDPNSY